MSFLLNSKPQRRDSLLSIRYRCMSFLFASKPQQYNGEIPAKLSCMSFLFVSKPQHGLVLRTILDCCICVLFVSKPQQAQHDTDSTAVVCLFSSLASHNLLWSCTPRSDVVFLFSSLASHKIFVWQTKREFTYINTIFPVSDSSKSCPCTSALN